MPSPRPELRAAKRACTSSRFLPGHRLARPSARSRRSGASGGSCGPRKEAVGGPILALRPGSSDQLGNVPERDHPALEPAVHAGAMNPRELRNGGWAAKVVDDGLSRFHALSCSDIRTIAQEAVAITAHECEQAV